MDAPRSRPVLDVPLSPSPAPSGLVPSSLVRPSGFAGWALPLWVMGVWAIAATLGATAVSLTSPPISDLWWVVFLAFGAVPMGLAVALQVASLRRPSEVAGRGPIARTSPPAPPPRPAPRTSVAPVRATTPRSPPAAWSASGRATAELFPVPARGPSPLAVAPPTVWAQGAAVAPPPAPIKFQVVARMLDDIDLLAADLERAGAFPSSSTASALTPRPPVLHGCVGCDLPIRDPTETVTLCVGCRSSLCLECAADAAAEGHAATCELCWALEAGLDADLTAIARTAPVRPTPPPPTPRVPTVAVPPASPVRPAGRPRPAPSSLSLPSVSDPSPLSSVAAAWWPEEALPERLRQA